MILAIIVKIILLALSFLKNDKQGLNIFLLIVEIIYFIGALIICIPYAYCNMIYIFNEVVAYVVSIIWILLEISIMVFMILKIILYKKESDRNG